ncbi:DUF397 domain-containing protein [Yinghuangia sp. YIM S09857]|uniref:DUF397 domain-containing protein n=1 Tax=Yinghuangia sp. YIM S09857 TaxID=3436929 RepID=UPI003F52BDFD
MNAQHTPAPRWFKSSHSTAQGGDCVETAAMAAAMAVRDSKDIARGTFVVPASSWSSLTSTLKATG